MLILRWLVALLPIACVSIAAAESTVTQQSVSRHPERRGLAVETTMEGPQTSSESFLSPVELDPERSLFIHDADTLSDLSFQAIMNVLAKTTGAGSGRQLFRQWLSSLAAGPDEAVAVASACPQHGSTATVPTLNVAFPMLCDDLLAKIGNTLDPFAVGSPFRVVAAVNRGDLGSKSDCGEYRLIVASNRNWDGWEQYGGHTKTDLLFIFEAAVTDDQADGALCVAIQRFWARFSGPEMAGAMFSSSGQVAGELRRFFLEGGRLTEDGQLFSASGAGPGYRLKRVIRAANLGDNGDQRGQIRTNTLTNGNWVLRQFSFRRLNGRARLVVTPVGGSPDPSLFRPGASGADLLAHAISTGDRLLERDINTFLLDGLDPSLEASQMVMPIDDDDRDSYSKLAGLYTEWPDTDQLRKGMKDLAARFSPPFTGNNVVKRLEALSCSGCHQTIKRLDAHFQDDDGADTIWRGSLGFFHIRPELTDGVYPISLALKCVFLPHRERMMRKVLGNPPDPVPNTPQSECRT